MEHPKELLVTEFKLLLPLEGTMFPHKIKHLDKSYKRLTQLAQLLMLNKDLPRKEVLMAIRQDNRTLRRHRHRQMPLIRQPTALTKHITVQLNTTIARPTKPRRLIIRNSRPRTYRADKMLITLRTLLGQPKQLTQRLEQMFIRHQ